MRPVLQDGRGLISMRRTRLSAWNACFGLTAILSALVCCDQAVYADVYAADLNASEGWNFDTMGPMLLFYRLNEPATEVTIEVFRQSDPATTIKTISGTTSRGLNSVTWDGTVNEGGPTVYADDYRFRVIVIDNVGHSSWTNITPKDGVYEAGSAQYAAPQGIAVNRDIDSEYFGRIYVLNSEHSVPSTNPGATAVGDGIVMLNNDMSFYRGSAALAAAPANVALETDILSTESPWRLHINRNNSNELVVGDLADGYENVWVFNGAGTSAKKLLDRTTSGPGAKSGQNHGNAVDVILSGVGPARKLWMIDEDYDLNGDIIITGPDISLFFIGAVQENYTGQPWEVVNGGEIVSGAVGRNYTASALDIGAISGQIYVANKRYNAGPAEMALNRYVTNGYGEAIGAVWSLSNDDITADAVVSSKLGISWSQTFALAVDEARGVGAAGRANGGEVIIFDPADGSILDAFDSGGPQIRDLDFDVVGNLYTTNETDQHVRMWSPPTGTNGFTTTYLGLIEIGPNASPDCNTNGNPDELDIAGGSSDDCNTNGIPDECDIATGVSQDVDGNGIADECDVVPPVIYAAPAEGETGFRVTGLSGVATGLKVIIDGTTNGIVSLDGSEFVDVTVPTLTMGQTLTVRQIVFGSPTAVSDPEIVTTASSGTTLFCTDFEYPDQAAFDAVWTVEDGASQLEVSNWENSTIGGDTSAFSPSGTAYRSKVAGLAGILPTSTHPLVWTVDILDETGGPGAKQYADLNADVAVDFFLAEIGLASASVTSGPETHYQVRISGNGGPDWVQLDQFDAPERSAGWHRFAVVFKGRRSGESAGHYLDVYVDGLLAAKNIHLSYDTVLAVPRIGSGQIDEIGGFFDEYCAKVGPVSGLGLPLDCNGNDTEDGQDISGGTSQDTNSNGIPDECDPDCNSNGIPDDLDIANCTCVDCNVNGIPDICEIAAGSAADCNVNGSPDVCDIDYGVTADCNTNGVPDDCDLALGVDSDCDSNGRLDACDIHPGGEVCKTLASDAGPFQEFGHALAVDGEWAVVGAPRSGVGGAVYVLRLVDGCWMEQQRVVADEVVEFDQFGQSVDISGDHFIVGANGADITGSASGAAYLFRRMGPTWVEEVQLLPSTGETAAQFGWSVTIEGEYAFVGAFAQDDLGRDSGTVYVFHDTGGVWLESQVLNGNDEAAYDLFGWSMDSSGDLLLVGSMRHDGSASDAGAAYLFANSGATWTQEAKLVASDAEGSDFFGYSVSLDGQFAVIGAQGEDEAGSEAGAAYVFASSNGSWIEEQKLLASDTASFDSFGGDVALSGDFAIIGARGDDDDGASSGSSYVFHRDGGTWFEHDKLLASDAAAGAQFGNSVAINGYHLLANARADAEAGSYAGAVYSLRIDVPDCNGTAAPDYCETISPWDFDGDGDTDDVDLAELVGCFSGPSGEIDPSSPRCVETCIAVFDADVDGDIDLADFCLFQTLYGR